MAETSLALVALIGLAALATIELVAVVVEARRSHPPGTPVATRLATLGTVLAVAGGVTALVAWAVTLPVGDAPVLAALGVAAIVLVVRVLLSLGNAASRS